MLDMIPGGLVAVANGLLRVAVRDKRLVSRMRIVLRGVVPRGFAMMDCGLLVVNRRRLVMLRARQHFNPPNSTARFAA